MSMTRHSLVRALILNFAMISSVMASVGPTREVADVQIPANFHRLSGPAAVVPMPCELLESNDESVRIRFSSPPITMPDVSVAGETYTAVRMDGEGSTIDPGAPDLPRVTRLVMIAPQGNADLHIVAQSYHTEFLPRPVAPAQSREVTLMQVNAEETLPREDLYSANAWYPASPVAISQPVVMRDVRFVVLAVYPVQVNPVTGEIRVFDQLEVEIVNTGGIGENEIAIEPASITPGFKQLYQSFLNFRDSPLDALPVVPGRHLYICQNNATVLTQVQRLVDWRRRKGEDAYIATTTITGSTDIQIRSYIQTEYNNSNGQLEFVTMVGDPVATAPYQLTTGSGIDPNRPYDNYFAALTGGPNPDPMQDVAVGRIPCTGSANLTAMVSKILLYESTPWMSDTTWYSRAACFAHTVILPSNPSTKEFTRQIMLQYGLTGVTSDTIDNYTDIALMNTRINSGVTVFNHRLSHNQQLNSNDLAGIACGRRNPFVCTISCGYGWFTEVGSSVDVTKQWVRIGTAATPNGAIGCVGMATTNTWLAENNILDAGMMWGLFALGIRQQGLVLMSGELQLYRQYAGFGGQNESDVFSFTYWANLMGDPGTPIWLSVPHAPVITRADSLCIGDNQLAVHVQLGGQPAEGCLVGLLKGAETFARGYTDANGNVNLPTSLTTTGYVYLTVTRKDLLPKLDSVRVVQAGQRLALHSVTLDDDNTGGSIGDGNLVLNPGETVDLSIQLRNSGNAQTVTGINTTLVSAAPGISVTSSTSAYSPIAPGANQAPLNRFRVQVGAVFDGEPVQLYLTTTSSAGTQVVRVDLTPVAGNVAYASSAFPDGNNRLDPGDAGNYNVTITNSGNRTLVGASGILRSLDARVTVNDSTGSFGTVSPAANGNNSGDPFQIAASGFSFGGLGIPMQLVITDANGVRDSVNFTQTVGLAATTSPTGPDAYGYYAYDNLETQPAGSASLYEWIEIDPNQGGPGFALNLADAEEDSDQVVVQTLPFAFQFYGEIFQQITICTNGWIAFGAYGIDDFRNYRIGSPIGPPYQVAAYWDDLVTRGWDPGGDVYVYTDLLNAKYIIQWVTRTLVEGQDEIFQIVLLDPEVYPSASGDGKILVQYSDITPMPNDNFNDNPWASVGIQDGNHMIGLEYSWMNTYPPTASPLADGRAIMYTTDLSGSPFSELTVISPNGGEVLFSDSSTVLTWFPASVAGNVNIEISRTGISGPYTTIIANTPNDGLQSWSVTGPGTATARIRIVPVGNPAEADTSNGDFTIAQIVALLSEDFEDGAPNWSHSGAGGQWVDDWHISTETPYSGLQSYKCGDTGAGTYRAFNDARLTAPVISNLPPNATLEFYYQIESELSGAFPDSAYDGGIVEVSLDGGAFQQIFPSAPYPRTFRWERGGGLPALGPMRGMPCYAGTVGWSAVQFDLSSFEGQDFQLRFRFGTDSINHREGWYIDNVQVFAPGIALVAPTAVTLHYASGALTLRWQPSGAPFYRVYSADTPDGAPTFIGSTASNSFPISGGAAALKKFYFVTAWDGN